MLTFSSTPVPSAFVFPKELRTDPLIGLDVGPEVLNTTQLELPTKVWSVQFDEVNSVDISSQEDSAVQLFTETGIDHVDLTFDTTGRPFVTYEKEGDVYIYWFDPLLQEFTQTNLINGNTPSCMLDKRYAASDAQVILAYRQGISVKYRLGSERFGVEYDSGLTGVESFDGAYMGTGGRIVFRAIAF